MDYQQTIDYLYSTLPMFSRVGSAAYKNSLDNIRLLCNELGNPQNDFKSIHVAGTNGKGSVSHMLASVFMRSGYRTGLYTSPHLFDFRERIRVNGDMADKNFIKEFTNEIRPLLERLKPSFFEITVAMAFHYFSRQQVDYAIIETGLGGRLDSTNIIVPVLSVITNIGLDHAELLGNTRTRIAYEKAGVIKQGIPVVCGEIDDETGPVFIEQSKEKKAPLVFAGELFEVTGVKISRSGSIFTIRDRRSGETEEYRPDLQGIYQADNLVTALAAVDVLQHSISFHDIKKAILETAKTTGLRGRWEVIRNRPLTVLEVAHNAEGIRRMMEHLRHIPYNNLHIILGIVNDKDTSMLALLPRNAFYYFTRAGIPRAMNEQELMRTGKKYSLEGNCYPDVNLAMDAASGQAAEDDLVLVCGSIFLVAGVRRDQYEISPSRSKA